MKILKIGALGLCLSITICLLSATTCESQEVSTCLTSRAALPDIDTSSKIIRVGPSRAYKKPGDAAAVLRSMGASGNGYTVEIENATYKCDTGVVWSNDNTKLMGVCGKPVMDADFNTCGFVIGGKGIWNPRGNHFWVDNVELKGAKCPDENGAGIRFDGNGDLKITNSYIHHNEDGILVTPANPDITTLVIDQSEFAYNSYPSGQAHNIYVNAIKSFTIKHSYTHHSQNPDTADPRTGINSDTGHLIKSRAKENYILYNRIADEKNGQSSYNIDLPQGGLTYIIGNIIHQSNFSPLGQSHMIEYGVEGAGVASGRNPDRNVFISNNTIVNDMANGKIFFYGGANATLVNNLFVGFPSVPLIEKDRVTDWVPTVIMSKRDMPAIVGSPAISSNLIFKNNYFSDDPNFVDRAAINLSLQETSPAIDKAIDPGVGSSGLSLTPIEQYKHPVSFELRSLKGSALDLGALEYASPVVPPPVLDTANPSMPLGLVVTAKDYRSVSLGWVASTDNVGVDGYKIYRNGLHVGTSATTAYVDAGLLENTAYVYNVQAFDKAGNNSAISANLAVTTSKAPDTQKPSDPTSLKADSIGPNNVSISWTASTDNVGVSGYKIYRNGLLVGTSATNTYADSGLIEKTIYVYNVQAFDAAGNSSGLSTGLNITTLALPDIVSPSIPSGLLVVSKSFSTIKIAWNASTDNVGVVGYKVFRNGVLVGDVTGLSYSDVNLSADTLYAYAVSAYDANNNASDRSAVLNVITDKIPVVVIKDTVAPSVPKGIRFLSRTKTLAVLGWAPSIDNVGVVSYNIYKDRKFIAKVTSTSYTIDLASITGVYAIYQVAAVDAAGNESLKSGIALLQKGSIFRKN